MKARKTFTGPGSAQGQQPQLKTRALPAPSAPLASCTAAAMLLQHQSAALRPVRSGVTRAAGAAQRSPAGLGRVAGLASIRRSQQLRLREVSALHRPRQQWACCAAAPSPAGQARCARCKLRPAGARGRHPGAGSSACAPLTHTHYTTAGRRRAHCGGAGRRARRGRGRQRRQ